MQEKSSKDIYFVLHSTFTFHHPNRHSFFHILPTELLVLSLTWSQYIILKILHNSIVNSEYQCFSSISGSCITVKWDRYRSTSFLTSSDSYLMFTLGSKWPSSTTFFSIGPIHFVSFLSLMIENDTLDSISTYTLLLLPFHDFLPRCYLSFRPNRHSFLTTVSQYFLHTPFFLHQ